jgi:hypothetical protein
LRITTVTATIERDVSRAWHGDDSYRSRNGVMTEWMSHDGYGGRRVEGQDVTPCSPASHQARCGVAFDMGHLVLTMWPAGLAHKWDRYRSASHEDKRVTG